MNAVAAANAIGQEKTMAAVSFPLTGDPETDLISGVNCLVRDLLPNSPGCSARALSYLGKRYQEQSDALDRLQSNPAWAGTSQLGGASFPPPYQTTAASTGVAQDDPNYFNALMAKLKLKGL